MAQPWEVPGYERPHQAVPMGDGWWRGPEPGSRGCESELRGLGVVAGGALEDGSWQYRLEAGFPGGAPGGPEPGDRARWIAARLAAAREAWERPQAEPEFMAILNLTPDSFSDGGRLPDQKSVARAAEERLEEGAAWLDLGAESTRPGAAAVPAGVQLERLLPALEAVRGLGARISVDTRSAAVARAALDAGAGMVNDQSALADPEMGPLVARRGCPVVLMHMRGTPGQMYERARYPLLLGEVADELAQRAHRALAAGIAADRILLDPGLGFAKTGEQTRALVARLGALRALGFPLLAGPSRKSFMAGVLDRLPAERDGGTAGAAALCAAQGVSILRLHRGGFVWEAARVAWACAAAARPAGGARNRPMPEEKEVPA